MSVLFVVLALATLLPWVPSAVALVGGAGFALTVGNPFAKRTAKLVPRLLQISIIGLGASMNLGAVLRVGAHGIAYTLAGIGFTLALGALLGRALRVARDTSLLVSVGTAICGGTAIAVMASVAEVAAAEVSVALATVFLLNSVALLVFPTIGHMLSLTQQQFGLWSALAVHDTSSVVGAALAYGREALEIATTVKLARALWIIPIAMAVALLRRRGEPGALRGVKKPWFVLGFIAAAALVTWVPQLQPVGDVVAAVARRSLVLTLFLIGASLTRDTVKSVGLAPFAQGALLWGAVAVGSLLGIYAGWVA